MSEPATPSQTPSEDEIVAFLKRDPGFLQRHPNLVAKQTLTHASGNATSLIERQVSILRERNMSMRRKMNELVSAAKENDVLFAKVRTLTLAMLDVGSWPELNEIFATYLLADFQADFVCCHIAGSYLRFDHIVGYPETLPDEALTDSVSPRFATLRPSELSVLFPIAQHQDTGSAVLIPLNVHPDGCLAVGSRDPNYFTAAMDTLFVQYISDVTSHVTARLLK